MAIALITNAAAGGAGSAATTAGIDTTGSDLLVAASACLGGGGVPTLTDSKSNTWTQLTSYTVSFVRVTLYYTQPGSVGSAHTFTASLGSAFPSVAVSTFSGVKASSPFDVENGGSATTGTTGQPGSVTPAEDNELLVSALCFNAINTISIDSSFNITNQVNFASGTCFGIAMAYKIQTSAGAENPTFSWSTTCQHAQDIAVFKSEAGGGAAGQPAVKRMGGVGFAHGGHQPGSGQMRWHHERGLYVPERQLIVPQLKLAV